MIEPGQDSEADINLEKRPRNEIAPDLPPLHDIEEIFEVAVKKAFEQGLEDPIQYFEGRSIRAATMCSGTESPLLALKLISKGEVVLKSYRSMMF